MENTNNIDQFEMENRMRINLCAMKERAQMTYAEIEEKSGVPMSTLTKVFTQKNGSPKVCTVIRIVKALGGTMDELCDGIESLTYNKEETMNEDTKQLYERIIKRKNAWIRMLFAYSVVVTFVCIYIALVLDF